MLMMRRETTEGMSSSPEWTMSLPNVIWMIIMNGILLSIIAMVSKI